MPSASQRTKKHITSRSITLTSFKSKTMSRKSVWHSKSLSNSAIASFSIRPLRMNTVDLPRAAVSILKAIDQAFDRHDSHGCAALHSFHPSTDHKQCNRVPNCISLKTGLEKEIGVPGS